MRQFTKLACILALCSGVAMGCGDDGDDDTKVEGCILPDDTCQESAGIGAACGAIGGTTGSCSKDNVVGTCVYTEDGHSTTIYYYDSDTWTDDDPESDCEFYEGTFTKK